MKLKYLLNKIFRPKSKVVTNYKDLDYIYIDTSNYSNVLNNIYNSINHADSNKSFTDIMSNINQDNYYTISKFVNTIHCFIIKDKSEYCIKLMEFIYEYDLKYTIYHMNDNYIISFSLKPYDIGMMIRRLIDDNLESPIYNMILSNVENIIHSALLSSIESIYEEDLQIISPAGFSNIDFYYSENRVLSGNVIDDDKLHIYVLEDHYSNYVENDDISRLPFSINDTIFELFNITIAIDNVYKEILNILLSNTSTNIIVYNKDYVESDKPYLDGRIILNLNITEIKNILIDLHSLIIKYTQDNNKLNLGMNATLIYNFLYRIIEKWNSYLK